MADDQACENTDREIWREREGDFYADSIHVTQSGGIGINCGGYVFVKPIREWFQLAGGKEAFHAMMDPTSRGDMVADKVRRWYEANRESWWDRHKFFPFALSAPDRDGSHADEFMLRLVGAVYEADESTPSHTAGQQIK